MKQSKMFLLLIVVFLVSKVSIAQLNLSNAANYTPSIKKQLNFFIVSKRKKGKLDLATRYNILRTTVKAFFYKNKFIAIVATDAASATSKIKYCLDKQHAKINTLWFDSHGMYIKGHSLFLLGKDEVSYNTLSDSVIKNALQKIAVYTDSSSKIIIGSCYGGATYERLSVDYKKVTRMNGDSLMLSLGAVFYKSKIYACESWVMTKPGLFRKRSAVAGYPGRKLFLDICYKPVWKSVSKWNEYNAQTGILRPVNPVALDKYGSMSILQVSSSCKAVIKKLKALEPGLFK